MMVNSELSLERQHTLNSFAEQKTIELLWTPGNKRFRSNGKADDLARLGAALPIVAPARAMGLSDA